MLNNLKKPSKYICIINVINIYNECTDSNHFIVNRTGNKMPLISISFIYHCFYLYRQSQLQFKIWINYVVLYWILFITFKIFAIHNSIWQPADADVLALTSCCSLFCVSFFFKRNFSFPTCQQKVSNQCI